MELLLTPQGQDWYDKFKEEENRIKEAENQITKFLDYSKSVSERYAIGYVSIGFRTSTADHNINGTNYILNIQGDGWFRRESGNFPSAGYGLMIRNIKITSRKPVYVGHFVCYKASIIYETNNFESEIVEDKFWVFVHKDFDVENVVQYIDDNIENWRA